MYSQLSVKEIYKIHLINKVEKHKHQMTYLDRKIAKTDLEIEILKHKLEVGAWSHVNYFDYVNYWNINYISCICRK